MADMNVIFSEDRGECLEHYGVKGMKWHQHLKAKAEEIKNIPEHAKALARATKKIGGRALISNVAYTVDTASQRQKKAVETGRKKVERILALKRDSKMTAKLWRQHNGPKVSDAAYVIGKAARKSKRY